MTKKELIEFMEQFSDDTPIVIFDDNEGEYLSIRAYFDSISSEGAWAIYSTDAIIIEGKHYE